MKRWQRWLTYLAGWEVGWHLVQSAQRRSTFSAAQSAAKSLGKPLLVIGKPRGQYPCGDVVLDLEPPSGECPVMQQGNVESMSMFKDKQFGAVFCSHVIEHTCKPEQAISELNRVADNVFIVYPYPWRLSMLLVPGHSWLVFGKHDDPIFVPWFSSNCNSPSHFGGHDGAAWLNGHVRLVPRRGR